MAETEHAFCIYMLYAQVLVKLNEQHNHVQVLWIITLSRNVFLGKCIRECVTTYTFKQGLCLLHGAWTCCFPIHLFD